MCEILVYDLLICVFYWLFVGLFIVAFAILNLVDDEFVRFVLYMLVGLGMVLVIVLWLAWLVVGICHV